MPPIAETAELSAAFLCAGVIAGFLAGLFGIGGGVMTVTYMMLFESPHRINSLWADFALSVIA